MFTKDWEIMVLVPNQGIDEEEQACDEYLELVIVARSNWTDSNLDHPLSACHDRPKPPASLLVHAALKLPKLHVRPYSGKLSLWKSF